MEQLFLSCKSKEPWPCSVTHVKNRQTVWECKGQEWDGLTVQCTKVINQEYLAVAALEKPILSFLSLNTLDRKHVRSILPSPCRVMTVSNGGMLLCASLQNSPEVIYTWNLGTGHLLSQASGHFQQITQLHCTDDDNFVVSAGADGLILVWKVHDLVTVNTGIERVKPFRKWSAHGLAIRDICLTKGGPDYRIFSCSMDQTVKVHSLSSEECLTTIMFDVQLTSCSVDPAETRLFAGTVSGTVLAINLYQQPALRERQVSTIGESSQYPIFKGHRRAVCQLDVNLDGTLLVSGDQAGVVKLWHILSRQALHTFNCKGPICDVQFSMIWPCLHDQTYKPRSSVAVLHKQLATTMPETVPIRVGNNAHYINSKIERLIFEKNDKSDPPATSALQKAEKTLSKKQLKKLVKKAKNTKDSASSATSGREQSPDGSSAPEIVNSQKVNKDLYQFLVDQILKDEPGLSDPNVA